MLVKFLDFLFCQSSLYSELTKLRALHSDTTYKSLEIVHESLYHLLQDFQKIGVEVSLPERFLSSAPLWTHGSIRSRISTEDYALIDGVLKAYRALRVHRAEDAAKITAAILAVKEV